MKQNNVTFFDLAENGYDYFIKSYKAGFVSNDMAVNAANIIEKYLKHIAMLSENKTVHNMPSWARDHNINKLICELSKRNIITVNTATIKTILNAKSFLYCARYPEYQDSRIVDKADIDICKRALVTCRNLTLDYIKEYEEKRESFVDDVERE